MKINSISNQNFGASLSGSYKSIIRNALNESTPAQVREILAPIQQYFPSRKSGIFFTKPIVALSANDDCVPQKIASVIVTKNNKYFASGAVFTPEDNPVKLLEHYVYEIKKIFNNGFEAKPADYTEKINWTREI